MPDHPHQFEAAAGAFRQLRDAWARLNGLYHAGDVRSLALDKQFKKTQKAWAEALAEFSDALAELQHLHDERRRKIEQYLDAASENAGILGILNSVPPRKRARARKAS